MERRERHQKRYAPYSRLENSDATNAEEIVVTAQITPTSEVDTRAQLPPSVETDVNAGRTGQPKTSFFENASNIVMNQPIIGNVQITQSHKNPNVLKEMLEYVIPGVEYDSSARDTPPRCHPGTRTRILKEVQDRVHDSNLATRMIWIHGAAGVGKSAIMQTLAEAESSSQTTFTTLFFSRPNERDDPKKAFTSLAYRFAVLNSEYQNYIGERLQDEPTFLGKSMEEQFRRLFITPFLENRVSFGSQRWVVFLDGLDECRGEREQCRIVDLITDSVLCHWTSTPFIWVIASRPEAHLKISFTKAKNNLESFWELEVPIDSDESSQDVERYLHAQFSKICENYPDSVPPLWPSEGDFLTLAQTSSGLFVFASTLVAYLLDGDPVFRLKHILVLIERTRAHPSFHLRQNPFQMLDLLYTQIMSDVPKEVLSTTMHLLGFYLLETILNLQKTPPSLLVTSNVLGLEQHATYAALRKLHSVLECPPPQKAARRPLRFLHASFSDFLRDQSRSQEYSVDLSLLATNVWLRYSTILCNYETSHERTCIDLSWSPLAVRRTDLQQGVLDVTIDRWMSILLLSQKTSAFRGSDVDLMIEESTLVEIFQGLGPTIFLRTNGTHVEIREFLDWLRYDAPLGLQQTFRREEFNLRDLDIERLIKSLCTYHWCYSIRSGEFSGGFCFGDVSLEDVAQFDVTQWVEAKEALWTDSGPLSHLVGAREWTESRVLGFEPSKSFIVVGPIDIWSLDQQVYYILPYSSESST